MKTKIIKRNYNAPRVEVMACRVERGFEQSATSITNPQNAGGPSQAQPLERNTGEGPKFS